MLDLEAFKTNYLVCGLSEPDVNRVSSLATVKRLTAGDAMIRRGQPGNHLYVILDGRVNVLADDGDKLAEVGPGSVLGEMSLIDARPASAHAVCVGLVEVAVIPTPELRSLMANDRNLGFTILANLSRVLCGRLRQADEKMDALMDVAYGGWNNAL